MNKLTTAGIIIVGGAVALLIGSFLHVVGDESAWASGAFPLFTLPLLLGILMAAHVLATSLGNLAPPSRILGLDWNQIHLALGIWSAFMMLCLLVGRIGISGLGDADRGLGFWLMLLGALALAVGAVRRDQEHTPTI